MNELELPVDPFGDDDLIGERMRVRDWLAAGVLGGLVLAWVVFLVYAGLTWL